MLYFLGKTLNKCDNKIIFFIVLKNNNVFDTPHKKILNIICLLYIISYWTFIYFKLPSLILGTYSIIKSGLCIVYYELY